MNKPRWQYCLICFAVLFLASDSFAGAWLPTKMVSDIDADGTDDSILYTDYFSDGMQKEIRNDYDADGYIDSIAYLTYNIDGYETISEYDEDADGIIDSVLYQTVNTDGKQFISEHDEDADGTIDSFEFYISDNGYPMMTNKHYEGIGKYAGTGNLVSIRYRTCETDFYAKEEEDSNADGVIDEITYITYDTKGHPVLTKDDNDIDGKFDVVGQFAWDDKGLPLRTEVDTDTELSGVTVTSENIMDYNNTYDGNGNVVKIEVHMHNSSTIMGMTNETENDHVSYYTYEYFSGAPSDEGITYTGCDGQAGGNDNDQNSTGTGTVPGSLGFSGSFASDEPVTMTASASGTSSETLYYKFYYRANYGTSTYDTSPWVVMQDYSTTNTCTDIFPGDGSYIVVVRVVTDPSNEPASLPIIGGVVTIGNTGNPHITQLSSNVSGSVSPNQPATYTIATSAGGNNEIYYKWYYRSGYGSANYDNMPWVIVQDYSLSTTCQFIFPNEGDYIVVVRAVTDPSTEPVDLPIIGTTVTCSE